MPYKSPNRKCIVSLPSWNGHKFEENVPVFFPEDTNGLKLMTLLPGTAPGTKPPAYKFRALQDWLARLLDNFALQNNELHPFHKHPFKLREINIQNVAWFSRDHIGFMKLEANITTDPYFHDGEIEARADWLPGNIFLRGASVAILLIVQPEGASGEDEKHVIFTVQPRAAASSLAFLEIPAGMVDDGTFTGKAASELKEEASINVTDDEIIDMTKLALEDHPIKDEDPWSDILSDIPFDANIDTESHPFTTTYATEPFSPIHTLPRDTLHTATYPSPGACDEYIPLMLCQKRLQRAHMQHLKGKATGLRDEGEFITLQLVPLSQAWRVGARDGKTLAALALYAGLRGEGRVPDVPLQAEVWSGKKEGLEEVLVEKLREELGGG